MNKEYTTLGDDLPPKNWLKMTQLARAHRREVRKSLVVGFFIGSVNTLILVALYLVPGWPF